MNGFAVLDKEQGMTSFKASSMLRKIYNEKKTGHTGTLDPMATGVLPVALGRATRFIDFLPDSDKAYLARFRLGIATDTLDITGTVLRKKPVTVTRKAVADSLSLFRGDIMQLPPMYSAVSVNGVRLYKLARRGVEVEREKRPVRIREIALTEYDSGGEFEMYVLCSKGTYIRSLISDLGEHLGTGAVMTALRRTQANGFKLSQAKSLSRFMQEGENAVIPTDKPFGCFPEIAVSSSQAVRFSNGGELFANRLSGSLEPSLYRVYSPAHIFLGLGEITRENIGILTVKRVI